MAQPRTKRSRISRVSKLSGAGAMLHWLGMIAMVVGLFAPLVNVAEAANIMSPEQGILKAAQQPLDSDTTDFERVVLVGDFQTQLGCGAWDVNCDQTRLVESNGLWTGVFSVPAGPWNWEIVAVDQQGTQYSIAENQVTVNDGQLGIYAEFNSATRQNNVWAVNHIATASGSFGDVALAQDGEGYVATSIFAASDGYMDMQVLIDGQPVSTGADFSEGVNRVTFDALGNITGVQNLGYAALTVQRMDADGNPLGGSCFVLDGASQTRGCDTDGDGSTTLLFPVGIQPGGYTLRETKPADGAEPLADQQIDVQTGHASVEARSEGPAAPEPGDLVVLRQGDAGNPIGGACFELVAPDGSVVGSACDEDGDVPDDGRIGLIGVPSGDYSLRESRTPEGVEPAAEMPVTVLPNQAVEQPVQSAALATEPPASENGDLVVLRQDEAGNPIGGACFELVAPDGSVVSSSCDEDGDVPDDGRIGLIGVPSGDYTLRESRTPDGVEPAAEVPVTVLPNDIVNQPVQSQAIVIEQPTEVVETPTEEVETPTEVVETETPTEAVETPTEAVGRVIVYRTDENGSPVGGSCFAVQDANGQVLGEACDEDGIAADDGTTGVENIPVGDHTVVETRTPDGYEKAPDTPIFVIEGDSEVQIAGAAQAEATAEPTVAPTEAPTEEPTVAPTEEPTVAPTEEPTAAPTDEATADPTEAPVTGRIVIYRQDTNGNPVGGSCFAAVNAAGETVKENCDEDGIAANDGSIGVVDVPAGDYTLVETRVPEGFEKAADQPITVTEGDVIVDISSAEGVGPIETETPTAEPTETESPTAAPTETETPTAEPTETETPAAPETGATLNVSYPSSDAEPLACVELDTTGSIGMLELPFACDNGENDANPEAGQIEMQNLEAGDFVVDAYEGPAEVVAADSQTVTLVEGEAASVTFDAPAPVVANLTITTTDGTNPVGGACYAVAGGDPQCDEGSGSLTVTGITPGDVEVTMTTAPDGYEVAAAQTVTVAADGSSTASFTVARSTTSLVINTTDGTNPVGGACYAVAGGDPQCDEGTGSVTVTGITPGDVEVTMTTAPDGYEVVAPQTVTVAADGSSTATFTVARSTTSLVITTTDGTNPVGGACYAVAGGDQQCDEGTGSLTVTGVTPGDVEVTMTTAPDGYEVAAPQTVTVVADGSSTATFTVARSTTSLVINTTDGTNPVGGACYAVAGGDPQCDEGTGSVTITGITPGDVEVTMTTAPDGYEVAAPQTVTVAADGSSTASFTVARSTTSLVINTTDGTNPVGGACYAVAGGDPQCDEGSGSLTVTGITPGDVEVTMTTAPDGYEVAAPQTVTVAADGSTTATFTVSQTGKDLIITTINGDTSESLNGACYTLDGGNPVCDDAGAGQVVFNDVPQSDATLAMQTAPDGFEAAQNQVVPADVTSLEVPLIAEVGSIQITIADADGAPLAGACVTINATAYCDLGDGDPDGIITIPDLAPDTYSVAVTTAPDGYDRPADPVDVVVTANETAQQTIALTATPPTTGSLAVTVIYEDQEAVNGACVTVTSADESISESACDDADGALDGVITFENLPVGTYSVGLQEGFEPDRPIGVVTSVSGNVPAAGTGEVTLTLPLAPTTGAIQITTTANGTNQAGACYTIGDTSVCDNQAGDVDGTAGVIVVEGLEPNDYDVTMTTVPAGFQTPDAQTATVAVNETAELQFALEAEVLPGSVTVTTVDGDGGALNGACYALVKGSSTIDTLCDSEPVDGEIVFVDVPAGTYQLVQTRTPGKQFQTAPSRFVDVAAGENTDVEIVMDVRPGRLTIRTVAQDEPTLLLQNACYVLVGDTELGPFCDANDGNVDGIVRFTNVPPGEYELRQTVSTAGFDPAANRTVTINPAGSLQITVQNARVQPPAESGTLVVIPLDPNGNPVAGGCYQVFDGDRAVSGRICDNADDQPARITIENLPVGELTLREQLAPSPDWQVAADTTVTIANGETTTVEIAHQYKPGNVVVQAVNTVGLPLQDACFTLTESGDTELCTDATGQATVTGLEPGARQLTQTQAPFGFKLDTTPREITVRPGQTTTVRVVFQNEPPPNTGTVQIQKFVCPAGDEGERTQFMGGAQGNQQLKQTAGCTPSVASFTLVAEDGSTESNATFKTNEDGRAQLTAVEGIYLLTETDPDLPGNSAARIRVGVGQMTTVIVINYISPPAPAPVTINVEGYTCPPGFNGSSFVDFQNSCMAESQLTNQITVRAESANRYKRVTGDTGVVGKTSFTDLPAGTYTIWAERPFSVPVSYLFCGTDPQNPNLKSVNGTVSTTQQSGSTITCRVFQVPPLFDANNGAIQVQKYNCPIDERQKGYDYKNECSRATEPIPFEIVQVDPKTRDVVGQPIRVNTNGDGIVQFPMLAPGTYKLTEVDSEWCFAQSNSVDAKGDVVVTKNKLSEVWVYNCVGTTSPPNTGSGDAAELLNPDQGIGPMQVLPNLIWPTVMLAGWLIWRDRKQA